MQMVGIQGFFLGFDHVPVILIRRLWSPFSQFIPDHNHLPVVLIIPFWSGDCDVGTETQDD